MSKNKKLLAGYRLLFGLLGLSAIITEIAVLMHRGTFNAANFFSYFTVENNILMFVVFFMGALRAATSWSPRWLDTLRSAATVYIIIVGVGFVVLLSGLKNVHLTAVPWDNVVLHYIIPVAALCDLLADRPKIKLRLSASLAWLLYPIAYVIYSLVRGAHTGWYPYPFLNPGSRGYESIAVVSTILLALALVLTWLVCKLAANKARAPKTAK